MVPEQIWPFLTQDVSLGRTFTVPGVSLFGALLIVALMLWYGLRLCHEATRIRRAFGRILPQLAELHRGRSAIQQDWIAVPSLSRSRVSPADPAQGRRDLDDLQTLDRVLRAEPPFATGWLSYRKTFAVEQPSWFIEPTVYAGRSADEYFPLDRLFEGRLDMRFYRQLPSLLTGIGLTFTFIAILMGLNSLHADGSTIEGLQGLINGLSGKFVTSIVGLVCANLFVFAEKFLFSGIAHNHRDFLLLIDQLFPQRVHDRSGSPQPSLQPQRPLYVPQAPVLRMPGEATSAIDQRLEATISALTTLSHSLNKLEKTPTVMDPRALAGSIGESVRRELAPVLDSLTGAIHKLSTNTIEPPTDNRPVTLPEPVPQLVDNPPADDQDADSTSLELGNRFFERLHRSLSLSAPRT